MTQLIKTKLPVFNKSQTKISKIKKVRVFLFTCPCIIFHCTLTTRPREEQFSRAQLNKPQACVLWELLLHRLKNCTCSYHVHIAMMVSRNRVAADVYIYIYR